MSLTTLVGIATVAAVVVGGLYYILRGAFDHAAIECPRCGGLYLPGSYCKHCQQQREAESMEKIERQIAYLRRDQAERDLDTWRRHIDSL